MTEIDGQSPRAVLKSLEADAGPLDALLLRRNGLLMGIEGPERVGTEATNDGDDEETGNWLRRSFSVMPDGELYVPGEDFRKVPPREGHPSKRIQMHVLDEYKSRKDFRNMLQRYCGTRPMLQNAPPYFGALLFQSGSKQAGRHEVEELQAELCETLGLDSNQVASATMRGEIGPANGPMSMALGGINSTKTARHGYSVSSCIFCYESQPQETNSASMHELPVYHNVERPFWQTQVAA